MEAVAPACDSGRLDCKDEVIVVLAVEEGHESQLALECLVDKQVFLVMAHGEEDCLYAHGMGCVVQFRISLRYIGHSNKGSARLDIM